MDTEATYIKRHARSFGAVAELYDEARPSYPAALFAHIAGRLTGRRILEVGAGTGKATLGLTALGLDLTCVEPDPQMAAVLAQRTAAGPAVQIEVASFESFTPTGAFDALVSAQAWHWTDPATRMDRAATLLRSGGILALFWNGGVIREDAFRAIETIYDEFALVGRDRPREPIGTATELAAIQDANTWPGDEIAAHAGFDYQGTTTLTWRQDFTAAEFGAFLTSTSHYQMLDPEVRGRLLAAVTTMILEEFDDALPIDWSTQCYDARRLG